MAKTIQIDTIDILRIAVARDSAGGSPRVYAEYTVKAGNQVVATKFLDLTDQLGNGRKSAAQALLTDLAADLAAIELA